MQPASKLERRVANAAEQALTRQRYVSPLDVLTGMGCAAGDPVLELTYRTHWMPADLPERQRERLAARQSKPPDLVVVQPLKPFTCAGCGRTDADMLIMEDAGPTCLTCADFDHLVFLPAGDAALTRRARQASRHAGTRGSGRVGRSAAGRALDPDAVTRAVVASVRHEDTAYDELLMAGVPREQARDRIRDDIDRVLDRWRAPTAPPADPR
jgi:hypothetical protein